MQDRKRWPWDEQERPSVTEYREWIIERGLTPNPLQVICVGDDSEDEPTLCGVLYVPGKRTPRTSSPPRLEIYLNGQLISAAHPELLPEWARFVYGALNILCKSTFLAPKALLKKYGFAIAEKLNYVLERNLLRFSREDWEEIVRSWTEEAKEAAALHDNIFEQVQSVITLRSNLGQTSLAKLMEWRDDIARNSEFSFPISEQIDPARAGYREVFGKAHGIVTYMHTRGDMMLLKKLASRSAASVKRVDLDSNDSFEKLNVKVNQRLAKLIIKDLHSPLLSKAMVASYGPETIPALLMPPARGPQIVEDLKELNISEEAAYDFVQRWRGGPKYWTLILNASSPLINKLMDLKEDSLGLAIALRELFHVSYMFATAEVEQEMKKHAWNDTIELIQRVCVLETQVDELEHEKSQLESKLESEKARMEREHEIKIGQRSKMIRDLQFRLEEVERELKEREEELAQAHKEIENLRSSEPELLPVDPRHPVGPYGV